MEYVIEKDEEYLKTWLQLKGFSDFASKEEKDTNEIEIVFKDTEETTNPTNPQIKALEFLIENSEEILKEVSEFIFREREELEEIYGGFDEERKEGFPNLSQSSEVLNFIELSTIYIHSTDRDGISYFGICGSCAWEMEHALGFIFHKERMVEYGDWNTAYNFYNEKKENSELSIANKYGLESLALRRKKVLELSKTLPDTDHLEHLTLFNWLISKRAIYSYRSKEVDLSEKEKVAFIISLTELDISGRNLEELPPGLNLLESLEYLNVRGNKIHSLPDLFSDLKNLKSLNISFNSISCFPPSFSSLIHLEYLDFSMNQFDEFPNSIPILSSLTALDASYNKIRKVPKSISKLVSLQDFRIKSNQLRSLPSSIGSIPSLKILYASGNRFSFIQRKRIAWWLRDKVRYNVSST